MRISDWSSDVCSSDLNAGLSAATFYNYFPDIGSVIHALCEEVTVDADNIIASIERSRNESDPEAIAGYFVDAYNDYWTRHRAILSIRNMEADRGSVAFRHMRRDFVERLMKSLLDVALWVRSFPVRDSHNRLSARIAIVVASVERLAAVHGLYDPNCTYPTVSHDLLRRAQVAILAAVLDPGRIYQAMREEEAIYTGKPHAAFNTTASRSEERRGGEE